jgi:hypothetical protein
MTAAESSPAKTQSVKYRILDSAAPHARARIETQSKKWRASVCRNAFG